MTETRIHGYEILGEICIGGMSVYSANVKSTPVHRLLP
jgi:hypothetical protein